MIQYKKCIITKNLSNKMDSKLNSYHSNHLNQDLDKFINKDKKIKAMPSITYKETYKILI